MDTRQGRHDTPPPREGGKLRHRADESSLPHRMRMRKEGPPGLGESAPRVVDAIANPARPHTQTMHVDDGRMLSCE